MSISAEFQSLIRSDKQVIILSGQTLSNAADLHGTVVVGISVPAQYSGTLLSILSSTSFDGTYAAVRNVDNQAATITCQAGYNYALVPFDLSSVRYIKFQSNTVQTGDCLLTLITRPV